MARPIIAKPLSQHRLTLVRMQQSIQADESIAPDQRTRILSLLEKTLNELAAAFADSLKAS